jgi:hypothetical protein
MQTLKLGTLKNSQTGNTAELLINEDDLCLFYREPCELGLVEAGQDHEGTYWATWTPKGAIYSVAHSTDNPCLDDALSGLETEIEEICDAPRPWYSETTGL